MPHGNGMAKRQKMAVPSGVDRLSTLPEELLGYVLSFLPSSDAVQTCVLSRGWRHRWKFVPALRMSESDAESYDSAHTLNKFVNYFLLLRDRSTPLDECEFHSCHAGHRQETFRYNELWVRYAVSCKVQVLKISNHIPGERWQLPDIPMASHHLRRLELYSVEARFLDFSSCPSLNELQMDLCEIYTGKICSPSLKHLSIRHCDFNGDARAVISGPSLIYLELSEFAGLTPFLQHMPSLASAFVRINMTFCVDCCESETGACGALSCEGCSAGNGKINSCVLLNGLADSVHLDLIADTKVFIFRKDLLWCPVFNKLKTLLVNEWCVTKNLGALVYFLQHSPILEKLTIQLGEIQHVLVEPNESYNKKEHFFVSKHLKVVKIRCHEEGEMVEKIAKILSSFGVPPEKIDIQHYLWSSDSFRFDN